MFFTVVMRKNQIYTHRLLLTLAVLACLFSCTKTENEVTEQSIKVALRDVGHNLLLANQDSTSLVLPITKLTESTYKLSFASKLEIEPSNLVSQVKASFEKANLPNHYITEVLECHNPEVAYSYEMILDKDTSIIPCGGRSLPKKCYTITVRFLANSKQSSSNLIFPLLFTEMGFILIAYFRRKRQLIKQRIEEENHISLGSYTFYPEQNKLIKEAQEVSLSKKECELLAILAAQPNQIVKREELMKQVWEDNGVIVGRSLDT